MISTYFTREMNHNEEKKTKGNKKAKTWFHKVGPLHIYVIYYHYCLCCCLKYNFNLGMSFLISK